MVACRTLRAVALLAGLSALDPRAASAQWTPPIGIPAPSFGIFETAPPSPSPWASPTPGFYYVDASKSGSTDSGNSNGTPGRPRATIPIDLPPGAVVELHGTYDASHATPATIVSRGTAARPVFIRGVSADSRPLARRFWEVKGTYLIIENIEFGPLPDRSDTGSLVIRLPASHVALRNSDLHGTLDSGGLGVVNWEVPYGVVYTGTGVIDNVVIYNNTIHDNGDVNATYDQDNHGIAVTDHVNNLWVVDNQLYRNSGDGLQINAGTGQGATTHHIYVGRNVAHHNKQTGLWVKQATDVVVSENETYGHRPGNSSLGQCMGAQYAPDWVWFLYNHIHDCEYGIAQVSDNGEKSHTFVIGNVIDNIHTSRLSDPTDAWSPSAVMMAGGYERHIVNNTIYNVDSGVNIASPVGSLDIADNIISTVTQPRASHVNLSFAALAPNATFHHNVLFGDPRIDWGSGQAHVNASLLAAARSFDADPQFLDAPNRNFHVALSSPAANNGELNVAYATFQQRYGFSIAVDADGRARPKTVTADIGAYLPGVPPANAPAPSDPAPPSVENCGPTSMPAAPPGFRLVSQGGGMVSVAWSTPTACGVPTSYILEGSAAPGEAGPSFEVPASQTAYQGGMQPGTFYMRVKARNTLGISPPSNEIEVGGVPGAPGSLRATVNGASVTLTWSAPATGGTAGGFLVETGSAPGLADIASVTLPRNSTSTAQVVPPGTAYLRVRAISIAGVSDASNEVKVTVR